MNDGMNEQAVASIEHHSGIGSWRFLFREPHPRLRPYVMGLSGFEGVVRPGPGHGLGSPSAELVISLNGWSEWRIPGSGSAGVYRTTRPFISGIRESFREYRLEPGFTGVQVDLTVLGARRLIGAPMSLISNREVDAREFLDRSIEVLQGELRAASDWPTRFRVLERFLGSRIEASAPPRGETLTAWDGIARSRGRIRIGELRRGLKISHGRLARLFREEIGLTPKRLAELVRFDHALTLATGRSALPWTSVAFRAGYYDQAHLINDFRRRMGMTPSEIRRKILPEARMGGEGPLGALYSHS